MRRVTPESMKHDGSSGGRRWTSGKYLEMDIVQGSAENTLRERARPRETFLADKVGTEIEDSEICG